MWVACVQAALQMWKPCQSLYADIVNDFGTESWVHLNPVEKRPAGYNRPARQPWLTSTNHWIFPSAQETGVFVLTRLKNMTTFKKKLRFAIFQSQD